MYCNNCGTENPENGAFCTACGSKMNQDPTPTALPSFVAALQGLAGTTLFLIATIVLTVSAAESLSVEHIIAAIGFWLIWATARKGDLTGYRAPLKMFAIFSKINYLLGKICGIVLMAVGGTMSFIGLLIPAPSGPYNPNINVSGLDPDVETFIEGVVEDFISEFGTGPVIFLLGIALTMAGLVMLLMAIFIYSRIKICADSALKAYQSEEGKVAYLGFVRIVLLIFAITASVGTTTTLSVNGIGTTLSSMSAAAANLFLFLIVSELQKKLNAAETN